MKSPLQKWDGDFILPEISKSLQQELLSVANELADIARLETLRLFRSPGLASDNKDKSGFDPVTEADRATEAAMREVIELRRPDDAILGEEYGNKAGTSGLTWVLDPIDGTRSYISGAPTWGVLIGVDNGAGPVLGIIDQPYIGERFIGAFGESKLVTRDGSRKIQTRACKSLSDAILFTTYPEVGSPVEQTGFEAVSEKVKLTRYGMDCYAYALLAMGQVDIVIEAGLQAYDVQGPQGVIEASGGIFSNWKGGPAHMGGRILATGDNELHKQVLDVLKRIPEDN